MDKTQLEDMDKTQLYQETRYSLRIYKGSRQGETIELGKDEITLGRGDEVSVKLDDKNASRKHTSISIKDGQYVISDCKSANGTFVNDRKIIEQITNNQQ